MFGRAGEKVFKLLTPAFFVKKNLATTVTRLNYYLTFAALTATQSGHVP